MDRADADVDRALDRLRGHPAPDRLFYSASALGEFGAVWIVPAALCDRRRGDTHWHTTVRVMAAVAVESALINLGVKSLVRRQRPIADVPRPYYVRKPLTSSFPSAHSASSFCAATLLADSDPPRAPLYYAMAAVIATSRVYVQAHRASDVLAGGALGLAWGRLVRRLVPVEPPGHEL
ncbi:MAG TPA: phosphatase PAP2 family protein [Acidimicrobiales bacterium]|nr:phosphatase PAP2 family protein [Acidimicrobiales bacterium]